MQILHVTRARDTIITCYNDEVKTNTDIDFIWNREVELISSGNNFEWFGDRK